MKLAAAPNRGWHRLEAIPYNRGGVASWLCNRA